MTSPIPTLPDPAPSSPTIGEDPDEKIIAFLIRVTDIVLLLAILIPFLVVIYLIFEIPLF